MLTLLLAAVEHSEEGSKTAFYIAGGALVAWAIAIGALGVARPAFAEGEGTGRIVMGISALLAFTAMASAVLTS